MGKYVVQLENYGQPLLPDTQRKLIPSSETHALALLKVVGDSIGPHRLVDLDPSQGAVPGDGRGWFRTTDLSRVKRRS